MTQNVSKEEQEVKIVQKSEFMNLTHFLKEFESLSSAEDRLKLSINTMKSSLSQSGTPFFKHFWEVRKVCLPLFKEAIAPTLRTELWKEYVELTREGRRLKNLLDEETAFACEQIDIAISALEKEIATFLENTPLHIELLLPEALKQESNFYENTQSKLSSLNVFASRIHSLRKELIKTEMRVKHKNKFFEKLSSLGDRVFPERKELILGLSNAFINSVDTFVEKHFSETGFSPENARRHLFFYRSEIKAFQSLAKVLTLNTQAFTKTREALSSSWDKLKGMEKELKKEFAEQKALSEENRAKVSSKIKEIVQEFQEGKKSEEEVRKALEEISQWMRELELYHHDVKALKEELKGAYQPLDEKRDEEEKRRQDLLKEEERKKREEIDRLRLKLEALKNKIKEKEVALLETELEECRECVCKVALTKRDKQLLEKCLKDIRDGISEKKEQALLTLSDDDKASLTHLLQILEQRKQRRNEIKALIEEYRCILGGSTLDFEKAMEYNQLMSQEKEKLEKTADSILEIEQKINQVKKKASS